jgi:hypothetical protein
LKEHYLPSVPNTWTSEVRARFGDDQPQPALLNPDRVLAAAPYDPARFTALRNTVIWMMATFFYFSTFPTFP